MTIQISTRRMLAAVLAGLVLAAATAAPVSAQPAESKQERDKRMA